MDVEKDHNEEGDGESTEAMEEFQISVRISSVQRTIVLMVKNSTTVRQLKQEMVEAEEARMPAHRQLLLTKEWNYLNLGEATLAECGVSKETKSLICYQLSAASCCKS